MKKQLRQTGSALGAFLALAYLAYAVSYTLRVGSAYVTGTHPPEQVQQAKTEAVPHEQVTPTPLVTEPSPDGTSGRANHRADRDRGPAQPGEGPSPASAIAPAPSPPTPDLAEERAETPGEGGRGETQQPDGTTVARRGPTYEEMRNKLEGVQR
jgi:hypothetical protein